MSGRLKLGLLTNELFSRDLGRMGGFGWAVQQVSRCFADDPALEIDVTILMGKGSRGAVTVPNKVHGSRALWRGESKWRDVKRLRAEGIDLLLCIDYRPSYRFFFYVLPKVPVIIWARDPWDTHDRAEVATLRIPGQDSVQPQGSDGIDTRSLRHVARLSRLARRPLLIAATGPFVSAKVPDAYGFDPGVVHSLPNIVNPVNRIKKATRPLVVSLARLDPTKRPWVLAALAERFPAVDFVFMGQSHFRGPGSWKARNLPPNVRVLGHVQEAEKTELLSSAWLHVSTSIHEGLSVSFLEALACETPLVACVDPEGLVSKFGVFVGTYPGTGLEALPAMERAVSDLLSDADRRARLGAQGRAWVSTTHNRARFLEALFKLRDIAGVARDKGLRLGRLGQPVNHNGASA